MTKQCIKYLAINRLYFYAKNIEKQIPKKVFTVTEKDSLNLIHASKIITGVGVFVDSLLNKKTCNPARLNVLQQK